MGEMADYYNDHCEPVEDDDPCCKYCHSKSVEWHLLKEGWRLFNTDGTRHRCSLLTAYRKKFR